MNIPYHCKFCKKPGDAKFDGTNPDVVYKMPLWLSMLACDRCADYRMERRKFIEGIRKACNSYQAALSDMSGERLAAKRNAVEAALEHATKKLSAVVCEHYRVTNVWHREFVNMLMDHPDNWLTIVNKYVKGIASIHFQEAA